MKISIVRYLPLVNRHVDTVQERIPNRRPACHYLAGAQFRPISRIADLFLRLDRIGLIGIEARRTLESAAHMAENRFFRGFWSPGQERWTKIAGCPNGNAPRPRLTNPRPCQIWTTRPLKPCCPLRPGAAGSGRRGSPLLQQPPSQASPGRSWVGFSPTNGRSSWASPTPRPVQWPSASGR